MCKASAIFFHSNPRLRRPSISRLLSLYTKDGEGKVPCAGILYKPKPGHLNSHSTVFPKLRSAWSRFAYGRRVFLTTGRALKVLTNATKSNYDQPARVLS